MANTSFRTSVSEIGGGRIAILLLLFALALYQFYSAGFTSFALVCLVPVFAGVVILAFRSQALMFWVLIVVNFFIQMKDTPLPEGIPQSLYNEAIEILLLTLAIINVRETKSERVLNTMFAALIIWCTFCTLEVLNDTCDLGLNFGLWYSGARLMAFQLLYAFLVFTIYVNSAKMLTTYLFLWGALALFSAFWIWKQQNMGLTVAENRWLQTRGRSTHILNAGTLIRYFSIYSDAANAGIGLAATAVAFLLFGFTSRIKKYRYIFLIVGAACTWAMFPTGTRTAIFCMLAGFMVYTVLSKSIKMTALIGTLGFLIFILLAFTTIGNGNSMIRRMRSAFDKNDASSGARADNQKVIKKYLMDAPFGLGIGVNYDDVPPNNKFAKLSRIPPDSEYVYIWVHTGIVGIIIFFFTTGMMFLGASRIVMFKLTSSSLRGIGAGLCCAFVSIQLGGYGNQVLMQFPNCLIFYGGLSLVYVLPSIEQDWIKHEEKLLARQAERKRIKEEKKRAKRV
jgi:hypothetical protein